MGIGILHRSSAVIRSVLLLLHSLGAIRVSAAIYPYMHKTYIHYFDMAFPHPMRCGKLFCDGYLWNIFKKN